MSELKSLYIVVHDEGTGMFQPYIQRRRKSFFHTSYVYETLGPPHKTAKKAWGTISDYDCGKI